MAEILKPNEVDPKLLKRLEKRYGSIDMENDFLNAESYKILYGVGLNSLKRVKEKYHKIKEAREKNK